MKSDIFWMSIGISLCLLLVASILKNMVVILEKLIK